MSENAARFYVCANCGSKKYANGKCMCEKCKIDMSPIPYNPYQWNGLAASHQDRIIEDWKKTSEWADIPGVNKIDVSELSNDTFSGSGTASSSGWVSLLRSVVYFFLVIGILSSLVGGIALIGNGQATLGFIVIVIGCMIALIGAAAILVFLGMAADVSTIRQVLQKK